jgi:glycine betaine/proline transport system substrate-binding protein
VEDAIMAASESGNPSGPEAAKAYLESHLELLGPWLDGVTTLDGRPGAAAVKAFLASPR